MGALICPICKSELLFSKSELFCKNNHHFDRAKSGYVNLLLSQKSKSAQHGDHRKMAEARRDFLNKGFYNPLAEALCNAVSEYAIDDMTVLDAGCGECFYTERIHGQLLRKNISADIIGVDISKDALSLGAARCKDIRLVVASVFHLPIEDNSCNMLLNVFAPYCRDEFLRVLKKGGILQMAIPLERHLMSLKEHVYDKVYENEPMSLGLDGFELVAKTELLGEIILSTNQDILNLFEMTPYSYKTAERDREKLKELNSLTTEIQFLLLTYRKA